MNTEVITIITGRNRFFGQYRRPWVSLSVDRLEEELNMRGYRTELLEFHSVANRRIQPGGQVVLYTFSQRLHLRRYITDIVRHLECSGYRVVPSYDLLLCHENKGYQELLKQRLGLAAPTGMYFASGDELADYPLTFPLVLKTTEGSNSKGVFLIRNGRQLRRVLNRLQQPLGLLTRLDLWRRKYWRRNKQFEGFPDFDSRRDYHEYHEYLRVEMPFILQPFIPGLTYDFRIIVLYDRFYAMKRLTRAGDFRASGSKRFVFDQQLPAEVLDFARQVYIRVSDQSPFLSLDIAFGQGACYLLEFQALHFGVSAIVRGGGYHFHDGNQWRFMAQKNIVETELARALTAWLQVNRRKE